MKKIVTTEKRPVKLWLDDVEDGAMEQARNLANLPFIFKHIALMPDAHQGYGMPIGGVMATQGVIVPNAVGVDIGCGMCAMRTTLTEIDTDSLKRVMGAVRKAVPVGFNRHKESQSFMPRAPYGEIVSREYEVAEKSVGTLGGGNHFIEFQKGSDGFIWIMIHSGSRNLGLKVANHYNKLAIELNEKWHSAVPKKWQLAFLPLDSKAGAGYLEEMNFCVEFALYNRSLMMTRIQNIFVDEIKNVDFDGVLLNVAHNYAAIEHHFNSNVMVHRKGATKVMEGKKGIIPGSQGTSSYIVKGKGNTESFMSCSHGAGRKMGRKQAERELDLDAEKKRLDDIGVIHSIRTEKDLDEAAGAYKDIDVVMANQADLVDVVVKLKPLGVIKG